MRKRVRLERGRRGVAEAGLHLAELGTGAAGPELVDARVKDAEGVVGVPGDGDASGVEQDAWFQPDEYAMLGDSGSRDIAREAREGCAHSRAWFHVEPPPLRVGFAIVPDSDRTKLRRLLETPEVAVAGRQRARLLTRLGQLKKQHAWGDLSDTEYQAERDATRATFGNLPNGDRIMAFDAYRARVLALPDAIEAASPARREELSRIVVQRVVVHDRRLEAIEWTPAARPFFERQRECPQGDSNP